MHDPQTKFNVKSLSASETSVHSSVKKYYGETLKGSEDLKTNACCTETSGSSSRKKLLENIHPEVKQKYYGCGLLVPPALGGCDILDLGCGAGLDCYVLAQLVGESGCVTGVDMTEQQLQVARKHQGYHQQAWGFSASNTRFLKGYLEQLDQLDVTRNSFDVIVSNCVINLCPDKLKVLQQAFNLLQEGGEMYFSDVYADRRIPTSLVDDPLLYGECLSGALFWKDFEQLAASVGFVDTRIVESRPITINNPELKEKVAAINFSSITYRLFKATELDPIQHDFGQSVVYRGGMSNPDFPDKELEQIFVLDVNNRFIKGTQTAVSGNTFKMLQQSRFRPFFEFFGDESSHLGLFNSALHSPFNGESNPMPNNPAGCCG